MYLQAGNFSVPLSPTNNVASAVHTSTAGKVLAWGIPGLFIWPFLIPAIYDGVLSSNANDALDADYTAKAVNEHIIQPHSSFNGIAFIPKEKMKESIDMFLVNQRTSEKLSFTGLNGVVR